MKLSTLCCCRRAVSAIANTDKITMLKHILETLSRSAPMSTFIIIVLLLCYSYQLLVASGLSTFVVYFFSIQIFGNWLLFFCTKSYIDISAGNSDTVIASNFDSDSDSSDRNCIRRRLRLHDSESTALVTSELAPGLSHEDCKQLRYCPTCKIYKPERSHHCSLCDRCIHQRDHHCFFLGTCVGGYNLCYFIVFCLYACIGCIYAAGILHSYYSLTYLRQFWSSQFHYYFYPVTIILWLLGKAELQEIGWVTLLYVAVATVAFTGFCVLQQLFLVLRGQTQYEYNKGLLMVHRSATHNFLHIFGRYWILHFLFPFPRRRMRTDPRSFLKIV
ncbi:putative palmitoyltransferase ZDHHC24 isoform X2 [Oratosquilla oratoria]|uniref:putative palmitoyltransferase ZDHHC24 isoform X2 n=1 Tax=Oratosquilla oratoria TaxID=337810 RepID=UPI003F75F3E9